MFDFFLFPKVKNKLAAKTLTQKIFRSSWEGIVKKLCKDDFAAAFNSGWVGAKSAKVRKPRGCLC